MKKLLLLCVLSVACSALFAQATDLVVDCQTPGWLSGKINYGDQLTVKNLKVTGYINDEDLRFIGSLTQKSLNGIVDLGDANIDGDNWCGAFKHEMGYSRKTHTYYVVENDYDYHLQKLVLPKSLKTYSEFSGFSDKQGVDTLVFDTKVSTITRNMFQRTIQHLIIGESVEVIDDYGLLNKSLMSVQFPNSIKYIGDFALEGVLVDVSQSNIEEFPNLEYIGYLSFVHSTSGNVGNKATMPDTLNFPKIKVYHVSAFEYREGMDIYLGEDIQQVYYYPKQSYSDKWYPSLRNVTFHIAAKTPPATSNQIPNYWNEGVTIYVPKELVEEYKKKYSGWEYANILAEPVAVDGIDGVRSQKEEARKNIFDLHGRKVKNPQNGLYIIDGKAVVIK